MVSGTDGRKQTVVSDIAEPVRGKGRRSGVLSPPAADSKEGNEKSPGWVLEAIEISIFCDVDAVVVGDDDRSGDDGICFPAVSGANVNDSLSMDCFRAVAAKIRDRRI